MERGMRQLVQRNDPAAPVERDEIASPPIHDCKNLDVASLHPSYEADGERDYAARDVRHRPQPPRHWDG
jgi:hypothetical protein